MTPKERMEKAKIPCEETGIQVRHTFCDICTGLHCGLDVYVKDGKAIKVEGTKGYPGSNGKLCTKGASNRQYLYRENRIRTPMRRVGERGKGVFEPISWEDAYSEIADKLLKLKKEYGPECVAWFCGYAKWYRPWLHRLTHSFGSLNYGAESSVCHTATVMAWKAIAGRFFRSDIENNSDLFVGWGCNIMVNSYMEARALIDFKQRGGRVVIIDTRDTMTSQKLADVQIKLHPGTDGALAWGLANIMIEHEWYDKEYVEKYVHGFEAYREYARGYTLEKTARITGVPIEQIMALAELYAHAERVTDYIPSSAIAHNINGFNSLRAIISLQVITGNIDREGTELPTYPSFVYADSGFPCMQDEFIESVRPEKCLPRIAAGKYPVWDALVDEFQIADLPRQIHEGTPYPIKAVMAFGMNHRMVPQPEAILKALDAVDFVVATDIIMTETCRHADIVLPTCTSMERNELKAYGGGYLTCSQKCVEPLYESKPDTEIICELARRLELGDDLLSAGYKQTMRYMISNLSVSLDELRDAELPLKMKEYAPYVPGTLLKNGFETPTGKLELWSEVIGQCNQGRPELNPLPVWYSGLDAADGEEYPLTLIAGARIPNAIHSRMHECMPWPRSLRKEPLADIHPADAERLNINDGDSIRVRSSNGSICVKAHITAAGSPGDVYVFHGYREADANSLIPAAHLDPYSGFPGYNQLRCAIEKVSSK